MTDQADPLARFVVRPTHHHVFKDYPLTGIPTIPAGWSDVSWRNDACPCWRVESQGETLYVFADYSDEDKRDFGPGVSRFSISVDRDGSRVNVFDSEFWDDIVSILEVPRLPVSLSGDVEIGRAPTALWAWLLADDYVQTYRMGDLGWRLGKRAMAGTWIDDDGQTVDGWIVPLIPQTGDDA
jgi:hypothetical protein